MSSNAERSRLERLRREAEERLDTFPSKVIELNEIIEEYMPESARSSGSHANLTNEGAPAVSTILGSCKPNRPDLDAPTSCPLSTRDRNRARHGISKRRCPRTRAVNRTTIRRYPGALGRLMAFFLRQLALYTKKIVLTPSYFLLDNVLPLFLRKPELKDVRCGPSTDWNRTLRSYPAGGPKSDDAILDNLINVARPAAVQLISDTTILKRWLQALALTKESIESNDLSTVSRTTETIDCWAYELFFHLKYLRTDSTRRETEKDDETKGARDRDDVTHLNLWHRTVQLRNNYIILYETLTNDRKIFDLPSTVELS